MSTSRKTQLYPTRSKIRKLLIVLYCLQGVYSPLTLYVLLMCYNKHAFHAHAYIYIYIILKHYIIDADEPVTKYEDNCLPSNKKIVTKASHTGHTLFDVLPTCADIRFVQS